MFRVVFTLRQVCKIIYINPGGHYRLPFKSIQCRLKSLDIHSATVLENVTVRMKSDLSTLSERLVLYTRPAVCIEVCKHVHGRP